MSEYELLDLIATAMSIVDRQYEIWLSATFALIVAAHFAGAGLSRYMALLVSLLYLGLAGVIAFRYWHGSSLVFSLTQELKQLGAVHPVPPDMSVTPLIFVIRIGTFLLGTVGAVYFLFRVRQGRDIGAPA